MSKIFKPRRGTKSTMTTTKANTVLANGEMFVEFDGTVGQSNVALKFGDGTSAYSSLPYALKNTDVSSAAVTITADSSSTSTAALNNVTTNKSVGELVGSLKQAISKVSSELTTSIDDKLKINNKYFYFDYKNGSYGYNTSSSRGADTFVPFSTDLINGWVRFATAVTSGTTTYNLPSGWKFVFTGCWHISYPKPGTSDSPIMTIKNDTDGVAPVGAYTNTILIINNNGTYKRLSSFISINLTITATTISIPASGSAYPMYAWYHM